MKGEDAKCSIGRCLSLLWFQTSQPILSSEAPSPPSGRFLFGVLSGLSFSSCLLGNPTRQMFPSLAAVLQTHQKVALETAENTPKTALLPLLHCHLYLSPFRIALHRALAASHAAFGLLTNACLKVVSNRPDPPSLQGDVRCSSAANQPRLFAKKELDSTNDSSHFVPSA